MLTPLKYRSDIDGLRALAVCSVVGFHAGIPALDGGFAGVDVFFVISGFLISGIIVTEIERDSFSLARFYERRVRRILPALFAMMVLVTIPASYLLVPATFEDFGKSAAAAALSVSNFYFWTQMSYFGPGAAQLPLLHTWSLAVEEQFYLFLPLYLLVLQRLRWRLTLLPILLISLPAGVLLTRVAPSAAFYYPVGRLWELALGGAVATLAPKLGALHRRALREAVATLGLGLILFAIFVYTERTPFPGWAALAPCGGAALLIAANGAGPTVVGRLLSLRVPVAIGLVSYSLYLWHWPIIVLTRIALAAPATPPQIATMLLAMVLVSVASWRFVEQPFRHAAHAISRRTLFASAGFATAAFAVFGLLVWRSHGAPTRFSGPELALALATFDINPRRKECNSPSLERIARGDVCVLGAPRAPATVALFADSFGDALMPGFEAAAAEADVGVATYVRPGCRPLVGIESARCAPFLTAMTQAIARTPAIRTVILLGRWPQMTDGTRVGAVTQLNTYVVDAQSKSASAEEGLRAFERSLERTVRSFGDKRVFVVAHVPEQRIMVPQTAVARARLGLPPPRGVDRSSFEAREQRAREVLTRLSRRAHFTVIDMSRVACDDNHCPVLADGNALYFDDNHPSRAGALRLASAFRPIFAAPEAHTSR